ncbi:BPL-N domain-containing protein [Bacillus sp. T33-2]|uniref:BPL-N domain-containing protein n=1 Tax=Bacillus sp. T33-2 TaxID=2054168 RepID=UPI000C75F20D|nr:BPL-N domain-containing protein [Bacillus sp. T33-2]PLR89822.1 hypothetical protein CVD19_23360 [Bacillus sp. T33-2]
MLLLSFERLGMANRQSNHIEAYKWIHFLLKNGGQVFQSKHELKVITDRFPEGHIYPAGTIFAESPDFTPPSTVLTEEAAWKDEYLQSVKRLSLPKRIGVYNGLNSAPFCFDPYKAVLDLFGLDFEQLSDEQIRGGILADIDLLIVPGGPDAGESYYAGLGDKGMEEIRQYVWTGGKYLGSCAGAYLPLTAKIGTPQTRMWLNIIDATDSTGLDYWRTGTGFVRVKFSEDGHPAAYGLSYGSPSTLDVIYWEGPGIETTDAENVTVLATYDEFLASGSQKPNWQVDGNQCAVDSLEWSNPLSQQRFDAYLKGKAAAVEATAGNGKLVLFSFHPEFGSPVTGAWEQSLTHLLILNSIYHLCSTDIE